MEYWKNLSLKTLDGEVWLPVLEQEFKGYYEISIYGRVKAISRIRYSAICKSGPRATYKVKILKQTLASGYPRVSLYSENGVKPMSVHRLVIESFSGVTIKKSERHKVTVNHKDGIKTNNTYSNLEYLTQKENIQHSILTGLNPIGVNNPRCKLKEDDVKFIRSNSGIRSCDLAKKFGIHRDSVLNVRKRKTYADVI